MIIVGVALENIKSYAGREFAGFQKDVNVLRGENGAGKSTILEAIGAALFNHVPYRPASDMVRRGCPWGTITVDVISELDGKQYQVIRRLGSSPDYYVYDPAEGIKVAIGSGPVVEWLRRQFSLGDEDDLETLFQDTVGPAQGTFTAPFLMAPSALKAKFNPLLHVDEYDEASDRMREVLRCYDTQIAQSEQAVAQALGRAEGLSAAEGELEALHQEQARLEDHLKVQRDARERALDELDSLKRQRDERDRQENECRLSRQVVASLAQQAKEAVRRRDESAAARDTVEAARPSYEAYRQAEAQQECLEKRQRERDGWRRQQAERQQQLSLALNDRGYLEDLLERVRDAERQLALLGPRVQEQESAEQERDRQRQRERDLEDARQAVPEMENGLEALRASVSEVEAKISTAEALRPLAATAPGLQESLLALQRRIEGLMAVRAEMSGILNTKKADQASVERLRPERESLEQQCERLRLLQPLASTLDGLERRLREAREAYAATKVELEQAERALAQVEDGLCPYLEQPCRNLAEGQDLTTYFEGRVAEATTRLLQLRQQGEALRVEVESARRAASEVAHLTDVERRLELTRASIAEAEERLERHRQRCQELGDVEGQLTAATAERQQLSDKLRQAQEAASQVAALSGLEAALPALQGQMAQQEKLLADLRARIDALSDAPSLRQQAEEWCRRVGDPRTEMAAAQQEAARRPYVEAKLADKDSEIQECQQSLAELELTLAGYTGLDQALDTQRQALRDNKQAHDQYLMHLGLANEWEARERESQAALRRWREAEAKLVEAEARLEDLKRSFDEARFVAVERKYGELDRQVAVAEANLKNCAEKVSSLDLMVREKRQARSEAEATQREVVSLRRTRDFAQRMRARIKEAGPAITRAILARISEVATSIYRETMDVPSAELVWAPTYEIELRSRGHTRGFRLLSGGEQMAAALAVRLALLRELSSINLAFLDEPTANMDSERRSLLASQVPRIRGLRQLFVITHDAAFDSVAAHIVHVVKENDVSRIQVGGPPAVDSYLPEDEETGEGELALSTQAGEGAGD